MLSDGEHVGGLPLDEVIPGHEGFVPIRLHLIDDRLLDSHLAQCGREEEIAAVGHMDGRGPFEGQPDLIRIGPWRHDEVVLHGALVPIIGEIDAGIDLVVLDLGIGRNVGPPLGRVIADDWPGHCR